MDLYAYDPYGRVIQSSENSARQRYRYGAAYGLVDDGDGLVYARARYYLPGYGRFLTRDALLINQYDPATLNRHIYVKDNPVMFIDKDGKWIHAKIVAYVGLEGDAAATNNTLSVWAQRDGEEIWQTAFAYGYEIGWPDFGMRRCPDPNSGINTVTMWMNDSAVKFGTMVLVDNIVVLGPIPVLSIERSGRWNS